MVKRVLYALYLCSILAPGSALAETCSSQVYSCRQAAAYEQQFCHQDAALAWQKCIGWAGQQYPSGGSEYEEALEQCDRLYEWEIDMCDMDYDEDMDACQDAYAECRSRRIVRW
jgi:hypothetical protein